MKELVFALELKGSAVPVPGLDNRLQARTSATGQTLRSVLKPGGFRLTSNQREAFRQL